MRTKNGFTFLEILVTTVIIAIMTAVIIVSYSSASKSTRDARRKKDLGNIQAALEIYKIQNGSYPDSSSCVGGGGWTWPGCVSPLWIPGLDETYIPTIPVDPKNTATGYIGNTSPNPPDFTYNYIRLTNTTYYLITRLENTDDPSLNGLMYGFSGEGIYVLVEPK
jgi:prepilin-type N-terminal cleavage/methylation domain-containing protein